MSYLKIGSFTLEFRCFTYKLRCFTYKFSCLTPKSLIVKNIADIIGKIKTKPNFKLTGLITINTPINPMITADHLLMPTFSLRKIAPAAVINRGIVLRRVYTSDIGINMRPVKNVNAAKISKRPLEYDLLS